MTGWWFGTFFIVPYIGLLIIPIDFHSFERGWPNHQPGEKRCVVLPWPFRRFGSSQAAHVILIPEGWAAWNPQVINNAIGVHPKAIAALCAAPLCSWTGWSWKDETIWNNDEIGLIGQVAAIKWDIMVLYLLCCYKIGHHGTSWFYTFYLMGRLNCRSHSRRFATLLTGAAELRHPGCRDQEPGRWANEGLQRSSGDGDSSDSD